MSKVYVDDGLFEDMNENPALKTFVGNALTMFVNIVVPARDQTNSISEIFDLPPELKDKFQSTTIELIKDPITDNIRIEYFYWI